MSKADIVVAILISSAAFAAIHLFSPSTQIQPLEPKHAIGTHGAGSPVRLSMGPDPGGHTGATVTPDTTKTGQPTADRVGGANQSSASGSAESSTPQRDNVANPPATTGTAPPPSTSAQPNKDR